MSVTGIFPTVAGNLKSPSDSPGGQHDRLCTEQDKVSLLPVVSKGATDAVSVFHKGNHRAFHMYGNPLMNAVVLEGANHFQSRPVPNMGESGIFMPSKVPLEDPSVRCSVKQGSPGFQLIDTSGCFPRVKFCHPPVIHVLTAPHRIGKMDLPVVPVIHIGEGCGNATFRHYRVCFSQQGFAYQANRNAMCAGLDTGPKPRAPRPDHQYIVLVCIV